MPRGDNTFPDNQEAWISVAIKILIAALTAFVS